MGPLGPARAMPRTKTENLRSIYVLLFLNIAFYFLEVQDPKRYALLFAFSWNRVLSGEVWRLLTYQFLQGSPLSLFFTLIVLYIIGGAVEEEWGTLHFLLFCLISTIGSAAVATLLGVTLLGSFVFSYSLLFAYASLFPDQVFYIFLILPIRVRWLAYLSIGFLLVSSFMGNLASVAALGGAALSYGYFAFHFGLPTLPGRGSRPAVRVAPRNDLPPAVDYTLTNRNRARFAKMKQALASASAVDIDQQIRLLEPEIIPGVNICPPVDFKPENTDGYCVRCEGFAECSIRHIKGNRPPAIGSPAEPLGSNVPA
jgi:membrane associated rhomboid family serine protease